MMAGLIVITLLVVCIVIAGLFFQKTNVTAIERERDRDLTLRLDSLLPQTQCGSCGYGGCLPYAEAIVAGMAEINQCPPGGGKTINAIADLLGSRATGLNPQFGRETLPLTAIIDEQACIGCVKCIRACPVDAIIGAARQIHSVMPKVCTGCELCMPPCPVNCITMVPAQARIKKFVWEKPQQHSLSNRA